MAGSINRNWNNIILNILTGCSSIFSLKSAKRKSPDIQWCFSLILKNKRTSYQVFRCFFPQVLKPNRNVLVSLPSLDIWLRRLGCQPAWDLNRIYLNFIRMGWCKLKYIVQHTPHCRHIGFSTAAWTFNLRVSSRSHADLSELCWYKPSLEGMLSSHGNQFSIPRILPLLSPTLFPSLT